MRETSRRVAFVVIGIGSLAVGARATDLQVPSQYATIRVTTAGPVPSTCP